MTPPIDTIRLLLERELDSFKREIEAYPNDDAVFTTPTGISNSAGTLALHCSGNLQHFIGAQVGASGYVRDRPAEFARRGVPRAELVAELDRAKAAVHAALAGRDPATIPAAVPEKLGGKTIATDVWLVHLVAHLAYHLGQVDYHRRITTGDAKTIDAVSVPALPGLDG